jgi:hypothetical protein
MTAPSGLLEYCFAIFNFLDLNKTDIEKLKLYLRINKVIRLLGKATQNWVDKSDFV